MTKDEAHVIMDKILSMGEEPDGSAMLIFTSSIHGLKSVIMNYRIAVGCGCGDGAGDGGGYGNGWGIGESLANGFGAYGDYGGLGWGSDRGSGQGDARGLGCGQRGAGCGNGAGSFDDWRHFDGICVEEWIPYK